METEPYPAGIFQFLFLTNTPQSFGLETWLSLTIILVLLAFSALISGSEVAFFSITHNDIEQFQKDKNASKGRIMKLLDRPDYLLSTILISNNFVNIGIILTSNLLLKRLLPVDIHPILYNFITIFLVTFLLVLFGEVAPKVYASSNKMRLAKMMARPFLILWVIFHPLNWFLASTTNVIKRRLEKRMGSGSHNIVTDKDIEQAIELTVGDTKYAEQDIGLLKSIIKFGNTNVKNIMRSRIDIVAVDTRCSFTELIELLRDSNYSRIPVYEESLDKISGVIHTKDLIEHFDKDDSFDWHALMRTAFFVPENKKIDDLFAEFQNRRTHMAIVVDEYGGTSGLVTLEDVLEEIVGEINDEFDEPEDSGYTKVSDSIYIFDGRTSINDVYRVLDIDSSIFDEIRGGAETIAGMLLVINGTMPKKNAVISCKGFTFMVVNSSERRIETVKITLPKTEISAS